MKEIGGETMATQEGKEHDKVHRPGAERELRTAATQTAFRSRNPETAPIRHLRGSHS